MAFFTKTYFKFFDQLAKHNTKEWFDANRPTYEAEVKAPFKAFVTHIIAQMKSDYPQYQQEASKAIFRINRDIRFAKDKSPYKTHMAAVFNRAGTKDPLPGYYMMIGSEEIFIGGGLYQVEKEQIEKMRQEIYYNNDTFTKIITEKSFKHYYGEVQGERKKILPPDYKEFALIQPLIANKQFYFHGTMSREDILGDDLDKKLLKMFRAAKPFNDFLTAAVVG